MNFHSAAKTWCLAMLVLSTTRALSAGVSPTDFVTITPIKAVGASNAALGHVVGTTSLFSVNSASYGQPLATAYAANGDQYQFAAYYDNTDKLVVGRRKMTSAGWSDWYLRKTAFTSYDISDFHDSVSIAIDGEGYLHTSWGVHCSPNLLYTRTSAPVLNDNAFSLIGDTVGNSANLGNSILPSTSVTYPQFYKIPGSGDLLFSYRTGMSGNGMMQLQRWSSATHTWSGVHASTTRPWINSDYSGDSLPNVNGYTNGLAFDSKGVLHTTWTWRTGSDGVKGFTDYQTNHNIMYAKSPDAGVTWLKPDGSVYARSGVHAIDESNSPPVISLPEGSSLMNQTGMAIGPDDTVYFATMWSPEFASGDHLRQFMLGWNDGRGWHTSQIGSRSPEYVNANGVSRRVYESTLGSYLMCRPAVAVDDENRVIVAFCDYQRGGKVSIAISESAQRNDWNIFDLNTENMYGWEPTLDLSRWQDDGVLSMFYQPANSANIAILEWNAREYYACVPEPAAGCALLSGLLAGCGILAICRRRSIAKHK